MTTEHILVVDDEEPIREIISSMLSAAGYKTRQACSGMEALALLNSTGEFELMLSDLMIAALDGIALLERSRAKHPDIPALMVTSAQHTPIPLTSIRNRAYD